MRLRKILATILVSSMIISVLPGNVTYASEIMEEIVVSDNQEIDMETEEISNEEQSTKEHIEQLASEMLKKSSEYEEIAGEEKDSLEFLDEKLDNSNLETSETINEEKNIDEESIADEDKIILENETVLDESDITEETVDLEETEEMVELDNAESYVEAEVNEEFDIEPLVSNGDTTYYVDADGGSDTNTGTSPEQAWKTLERVNETTFLPGDSILFEKGDEWTGQLSPKGSGSEEKPIIIGSYGSSNERPVINGNSWCGENGDDIENKIFNAAVFFYNQEYWEITSLEITNFDPENDESHIMKYGVLIMGKDAGTLHHMYCRDLYVHDVICIPIGNQAGIGRGGIIYIIRGNEVETCWDDILVEDNYLEDINHYGINLLSTWGSSSFPNESGIPSSESSYRVNSTNIIIRGNYCYNIGNAAICPSAYEEALIEYNVSNTCNSGPNGNVPIWWENGDKTIVQYNEVFNSGASDSKEDSQAFDADVNATLNYIQYNYTHDNPSGAFFECPLGTPYTTYIRYNISVNDGYGRNSHGGGSVFTLFAPVSGSKIYAYNNLIYMDSEHDAYITSNWSGASLVDSNYQFWNNVFYTNGTKGWGDSYKGIVKNNAYGGTNTAIIREDDENAVFVSEDDFVGLGTGTSASYADGILTYGNVDGYRITDTSVCVDSGIKVLDNGGKDYFGTSVQELVKPNIGPDNRYNNAVEAESSADEIIINFENVDSGNLTEVYNNCNFGNRGWNVSEIEGNKKLWASTYTSDMQANKIAIPDDFALTSFQAECTDGSAEIIIEAGDESKTFQITENSQVYLTGFKKPGAAVYIVIDAETSISAVKFDNLVIERVGADVDPANVTVGKTATASSYERNPGNGIDADETTLWVANGNQELEGAWWQVDLEENYKLEAFEIIFEKAEENAWKYKVEGSADNSTWDLLWDQTANTDGSKKQTASIPEIYADTMYRYLRVTITGLPSSGMWPAFAEFNAFKAMPEGNVALDGTATASSIEASSRAASCGIDDNESTLWIANGNQEREGAWWKVELEDSYILSELEIVFEKEEENAWKYKVEGSTDNSTWDLLWDQTSNTDGNKSQSTTIPEAFSNVAYRYLKVTITGLPSSSMWPALAEFRAYVNNENDTEKEIILTEPGQYIDLDLAFGQPVKASSELVDRSADNVTDRNETTTWKPNNSNDKAFLQIDLDREYNIENCNVVFAEGKMAYVVEVHTASGWTPIVSVTSDDTRDRIPCVGNNVDGIRFVFENPTLDLEIAEVTFEGLDADISKGKRILVMAPHEDDEILMAGGIMKRAIEVGDTVDVVVATNGDYEGGAAKAEVRIRDTVNALEKIGVTKDHIYFLGYADTAGLGVGKFETPFTNSFLYKLYVADDNTILESAQGNTKTYGSSSVKMDYHYELTGTHADYTRSNFVNDLQTLVEACNPTDIYVTSRYDMHFDHAYFGLFATEVVQNIQKEDSSFNPTMHEAIIHTHLTDEVYPTDSGNFGYGHEDDVELTTWFYPEGLDEKTILNWSERESVLVPYSMRQTPYRYNLKDQALRQYTTEYYSWIASFAKVNEVFWKRDFSSIAHLAKVTASSETVNANRSLDQSSKKAIDGITDGYATGLAENHTRFAHAEWASNYEGEGAWINLEFDNEKVISKVVLYDRPNLDDQIVSAHLEFDNGARVLVGELPNDGRPLTVEVDNISSRNVKLVVDKVSDSTMSVGLAEIEIFAE